MLTQAIQHGGANDEVFAVLDRSERLGVEPVAALGEREHSRGRSQRRRRKTERDPRTRFNWPSTLGWVAVLLVVAVSGLLVVRQWVGGDLAPARSGFLSEPRPAVGLVAPLPVPSVAALALGWARALAGEGRSSEALGVLETVGGGGGLRPDIEVPRGQLQRTLLDGLKKGALGSEQAREGAPVARPAF